MMDKERRAFEAWWNTLAPAPYYEGIEWHIAWKAWQAARAIEAACTPDGFVLVPKEADMDMHRAGLAAYMREDTDFGDVWEAMLAAAPLPAKEQK
jgi:hypothetical protein